MELAEVLRMNTGDGDDSYAKNSFYQKSAVVQSKRAIHEAVLEYCSTNPRAPVFTLADLGCSSGPNSISLVSNVVAAVTEVSRRLGRRPPAMQAFFNDLPGTDFNTLFRSLPRQWNPESEEAAERCFIAGVPGSFYGRLFPDHTVHLFHSAFAVHFLSQGFIDEEKVDYFNFPTYIASRDEVELEISREGSFSIKLMELFNVEDQGIDRHERNNIGSDQHPDDRKDTKGERAGRALRAIYESMLAAHFGEDMMDVLFQRLGEAMDAYFLTSEGSFHAIMVSLEKKCQHNGE